MLEIEFISEEKRAVAYIDNKEIGECCFIENDDVWNIIHTYVNEEYQGRGIARKLVLFIQDKAKDRNKKIIAECSYAKKILDC